MRVDNQEGYDTWRAVTSGQTSDQAFLVESVESIADYAEEFKDKNNLTAVESLRQGYTQYQNEVGVLHPNIMARILAIFAIWWEYAEEVITECTPFETSIIMFGVLEYQRELESGEDVSVDGGGDPQGLEEGESLPDPVPEGQGDPEVRLE